MSSASNELQPILRNLVQFAQYYHQHPQTAAEDPDGLTTVLSDLRSFIRILGDHQSNDPTAQFASLLTTLAVSNLDKHERMINAFVQAISSQWNRGAGLVDQRPSNHDPTTDPVCDIVGTGGDGFNTFNVSTAAAIVAAGAGVRVCKHGNRASSSASGSGDLIIALGVPLESLEPNHVAELIQDSNCHFNFLYSPKFYPIFSRLSPIRKSLGFPTIFNLLGPLLNPARPDRLIIGVSKPSLGPIFCRVLHLSGYTKSWVVCSEEGLDEISTAGETSLWKLEIDGSIHHQRISPEKEFGLNTHSIDLLTGKSAQENLMMLNDLLAGQLKTEKHRAILDFILLNSAALLVLAGKADDFKHGVSLARDSLMSGKAKDILETYKLKSQAVVASYSKTVS